MTKQESNHLRLRQVLQLVGKEDTLLMAVRGRLFPSTGELDNPWLVKTLASDTGIDRLESFASKFARMQDTVIDKLLPQLLVAAGENPLAAIDNLNRAERLGFITSTDAWLEMRRLRNRLVHEYIESPEEMLPALRRAREFTDELHETYMTITAYAKDHLGISNLPM